MQQWVRPENPTMIADGFRALDLFSTTGPGCVRLTVVVRVNPPTAAPYRLTPPNGKPNG